MQKEVSDSQEKNKEEKKSVNEEIIQALPKIQEEESSKTEEIQDEESSKTQEIQGKELSKIPEELPKTVEIDYLRYQQLLQAEAEKDEYLALLKRLKADFENYKKRNNQQLQNYIKMANKELIKQLLVILDNFEYALSCNDSSSIDSVKEGINLINKQLFEILQENGLNKIEALSKPFDPYYHEVITQEVTNTVPEGTVVKVLREGYTLYGDVIRPAQVVVAKGGGNNLENG